MITLKDKIELFRHGIDVFGSARTFKQWLSVDNFYFDRKPPYTFLNTLEGIVFIGDRLYAIEYGTTA